MGSTCANPNDFSFSELSHCSGAADLGYRHDLDARKISCDVAGDIGPVSSIEVCM
jgi:hypothetical protein